ncbi:MAG TPA: anthrone oxygenase family protein [Vineibacter sp.]|nr:anthrone oxygenase family protein [Vineibacter sp.]
MIGSGLMFGLTLVTALGCGLVAGIFFAFSTFVMGALARLAPAQGITAMNSINVVVINPWFGSVFFGTAVVCAVLLVIALVNWHKPGSVYVIIAAVLYVVGALGVTMAFNVPRNNALAAVDPASAEGARLWADYVVTWTFWNHVRTIAPLLATALLIVAIWVGRDSAV